MQKIWEDLIYFNCNPRAELELPKHLKSGVIKLRLKIKTERDLLFDEDCGVWQWHKTWNIPTISVQLEVSKFHLHNTFCLEQGCSI